MVRQWEDVKQELSSQEKFRKKIFRNDVKCT